jgi:hypothetical protein
MFEPMNPTESKRFLPSGWRGVGLRMCLLLSFAAPASGASASKPVELIPPSLGTLFYSAPERAAIARARFGQEDEESSAIVRVTGIVKRNRGKSTAWINGQAVPEGQSQAPAVTTTISTSGVVVDGQRVRVGEALDIHTGQRADIVEPGAVTIRAKK